MAGHEVVIIDLDNTQFQRLGSDFKGKKVVGNGMEQDTLRRAGIEGSDLFLAITQGDNRNIMAAQMVRLCFNVPRALTRIKDPLRAASFAELGLETFCTTTLAADYAEHLILNAPTSSRTEVRGAMPASVPAATKE
jgi:trk system potassium uptake protein TrkA